MKIDLHVHSAEISTCGHLTAEELIPLYVRAEYDAIVLTNHFNRDHAVYHAQHGFPDFARHYLDCYELAAEIGRQHGLLVLFGYEFRFDTSPNDYLVYGLPDDLRTQWDRLFAMQPADFGMLAKERDFLFYQAHPFRNGMKITPPACLFGIEIKNAHPRHDSRNDIAAAWAKKFNLHGIGGSDCHQIVDVGTSGIITPEKVTDMDGLLRVLRNDLYTII